MKWKLKEILFMAICAAVFGVAYLGMVYLGAALTGILTPSGWGILGYEPIYGVWFMAASFITYVIRKPGIGIIAEMLAALLEVLMGNMFGPIIFISGFIQGLGCEAAFFFTKYRKYDQTTMILSAVGASVLSFIWTGIRQSYWNMSIGVVLLILVIRTISAIIFCGFGSRFLAEGLAKAGVLKGYAIASDSEDSYGK